MEPDRSPAFQFYPREFIGDGNVSGMSLQERGAYITLLCFCWNDGSLPTEVSRLATMCCAPLKVFAAVWPAVRACFRERDGRYVHPRLDKERQKQAEHRQRQSEKGSRGAARRWPGHSTGIAGLIPDDGSASASASAINPNPLAGAVEATATIPKIPSMPESLVVESGLAEQAAAFLERWHDVYASARSGAFYRFAPGRDWPNALDLVHAWPDVTRLALMADVFLRRADLGQKNIPGTIGQFKHMAPDCDRLLRENGR
jgi:uncharacterized protein YdaU (DUF1376 family)